MYVYYLKVLEENQSSPYNSSSVKPSSKILALSLHTAISLTEK